jgi:hypothetical protein
VEANLEEARNRKKWNLLIVDPGPHQFGEVKKVFKKHALVDFFNEVCDFNKEIKFIDAKENVEKQVDVYDCGIMTLRRMLYCAKFNEPCNTKIISKIMPPANLFRIMVLEILLANASGISPYLIAPNVYFDPEGKDRVDDTRSDGIDTDSLSSGNIFNTRYLEENVSKLQDAYDREKKRWNQMIIQRKEQTKQVTQKRRIFPLKKKWMMVLQKKTKTPIAEKFSKENQQRKYWEKIPKVKKIKIKDR